MTTSVHALLGNAVQYNICALYIHVKVGCISFHRMFFDW